VLTANHVFAKSIAAVMGFAWNIGNSLEVPRDPLLRGIAFSAAYRFG